MTTLYTNGCSFTHGHRDHTIIHHESGLKMHDIKQDSPWAWPRRLEPVFDAVVNEAWSGGSNSRIFRRSIEYLTNQSDCTDLVIVLQFTDLNRSEWYDDDSQTWVGQLNHRLIYDDRSWNKRGINRDFNKKKGEHNIENRALVGSDLQILMDFLMQLSAFERYCESRGISKILYTAMSNKCDLSELVMAVNGKENDFRGLLHSISSDDRAVINTMLSQIRTDRVIMPMARLTKNHVESATDGHPNEHGHRVFAEYIQTQMRDRGFI